MNKVGHNLGLTYKLFYSMRALTFLLLILLPLSSIANASAVCCLSKSLAPSFESTETQPPTSTASHCHGNSDNLPSQLALKDVPSSPKAHLCDCDGCLTLGVIGTPFHFSSPFRLINQPISLINLMARFPNPIEHPPKPIS